MNADDFRRIALSMDGAEESSHMGSPDFRVGGKIFATLASQKQGYGNLKLTLEQRADFARELPDVFLPVAGGWGRTGMTPYPAGESPRRRSGRSVARRLEAESRAERKSKDKEGDSCNTQKTHDGLCLSLSRGIHTFFWISWRE